MLRDNRIFRWDVEQRLWLQKADPGLEFMDFEVDLTGRILLVATADPRTRSYRALLEAVEDGGTTVLVRYPDPGNPAWGRKDGTVGIAQPLPGLQLPLFPDPQGHLIGLEEALGDFAAGPTPAGWYGDLGHDATSSP